MPGAGKVCLSPNSRMGVRGKVWEEWEPIPKLEYVHTGGAAMLGMGSGKVQGRAPPGNPSNKGNNRIMGLGKIKKEVLVCQVGGVWGTVPVQYNCQPGRAGWGCLPGIHPHTHGVWDVGKAQGRWGHAQVGEAWARGFGQGAGVPAQEQPEPVVRVACPPVPCSLGWVWVTPLGWHCSGMFTVGV